MGQYHMPINITKGQFLHPHDFGDGLKLLEFGSGGYTMTALAFLLSTSNGLGGGDLFIPEDAPDVIKDLIGSWAGDKIVIVGDYDGPSFMNKKQKDVAENLYRLCCDEDEVEDIEALKGQEFKNISGLCIQALLADKYIADELKQPRYESNPKSYLVHPNATVYTALKKSIDAHGPMGRTWIPVSMKEKKKQ